MPLEEDKNLEKKEDYSVIRIEDLRFANTINKLLQKLEKEGKKDKLTSKVFDTEFKEVSEFLYTYLPYYLFLKFDIHFQDIGFLKRHSKDIVENLLAFLTTSKFITAPIKAALSKIIRKEDIVENLDKVISELYKKYYKDLREDQKKVFYSFYNLSKDEKLSEKNLATILKAKVLLDNVELVRAVKLIQHTANEHDLERDSLKKILDKETKKLFKTDTPSFELLQKTQKEKPEEFKEWRKIRNEFRSVGKDILEEVWKLHGYTIETPEKANELLRSLKLETTIDPGFVGLVSPGDTQSVQFKYYTSKGLELSNPPGKNVVMNKEYDPDKDDSYYCKGIPASESSQDLHSVYTLEYLKNKSDRLFTKAAKANEQIEDVRIQNRKDLLKSDQPIRKNCALVIAVIDITAGRIGNANSEKLTPPTYGIHNLKYEHLTIKGNKAVLEYVGKDEQPQKHVIDDEEIVNELKNIKQVRKKGQYLFSRDGNKPISASTIRKYLKEIGWEDANPHTIRKYHANLIFSELLDKEFKTKKGSLTGYEETIDKISKKLGNTKSIAVSAYTSPTMLKEFFVKNNFDFKKDKIPAVALKTIKKAGKL